VWRPQPKNGFYINNSLSDVNIVQYNKNSEEEIEIKNKSQDCSTTTTNTTTNDVYSESMCKSLEGGSLTNGELCMNSETQDLYFMTDDRYCQKVKDTVISY